MGTKPISGMNGNTEIFFVGSIRLWGLIFTAITWYFIWKILQKTTHPKIYYTSIILISLHYPTIVFIEAQLIILLIYFNSIINKLSY